jgi:hypothetical protein
VSLLINFQKLWRGELPLGISFWQYLITFDIALNILATLGALAVYLNGGPIAIAGIIHFLPVPYSLFAATGTWRSADSNLENPTLVKMAIAMWVILLLLI